MYEWCALMLIRINVATCDVRRNVRMKTIIVLCAIVGVCFRESLSPPPVDVEARNARFWLIWPHAVIVVLSQRRVW